MSRPGNFHSIYHPTSEFYKHIINSLEDYAIFTTDKHLVVSSWNAGSQKILGYGEEEIIGRPIDIIFTEEDKINKTSLKESEKAINEGRARDERWHVRKDKSRFWAYGLVFPLYNDSGNWIGFVKILRDLTDEKKTDEALKIYSRELEELNSHKETIVSVLSHDLRSPVNSIIGTSEILSKHIEQMEKAEAGRMLDVIHKSAKKTLDMLDNLVVWARIKYAKEAFSPKSVKLCAVVAKVFGILKENAAQKGIILDNRIEEDIFVLGDEKMLFSVVQNLLSNAIKFSHPGTEVVVFAEAKEDKVIVRIKDTGTGMTKELADKLFTSDPKNTGKGTRNETGAGIGLLLVKEFLEKHNGEIWVESEEGKGTTIIFSLAAVLK